jgi:Ca2+:H+ antiporter
MIPLAAILGDATEALAAAIKNDTLSGLLNATFGNAVELIMTIMFLRGDAPDRFEVVKSTLLGSILSNMLLVLGMSFWFGGMYKWWRDRKQKKGQAAQETSTTSEEISTSYVTGDVDQSFGQMSALLNSTMLLTTALILGLNTVFIVVNGDIAQDNILPVSRYCSIVMVLSYAMYIFFQMVTHEKVLSAEDDQGDDEEAEDGLSLKCSLSLLFGATAIVSYSSELLTDALEGALEGSGIGVLFTGIILLPIVGNACEHASAIRFALQDRAGLSVGIAVGSSVQIAIFVYPLAVLMGWAIGDDPETGKNIDLNFGALNVAVLILSVLVVLSIVLDGTSNWLEGYMLCTAYTCIAILYWYADSNKHLHGE